MILQDPAWLPAAPPGRMGGGEKRREDVPAQVCEFLVDSLQRHVDMW